MANYQIIGGDGRQYGPIPADTLRQWIAEGRLNAQSLVQGEGCVDWNPLGTIAELADAFGTATVPPIATRLAPEDWSQQVLARPADLRFGECLRSGFSFLAAHPGFVIGAVGLAWLVNLAMRFVPFIGGILQLILGGVVAGGLYLACLCRMRGEGAGIGNIFDGFKLCFVQLMLAGAITQLLSGLGFLFCVLPGLYLKVAWTFALPLVADKRLEFWSAMQLSLKQATRVWFPLFFLLLLVFLPFIGAQIVMSIKLGGYLLGLFQQADYDVMRMLQRLPSEIRPLTMLSLTWGSVSMVALLISQCLAAGALMRAYENLFGERKP